MSVVRSQQLWSMCLWTRLCTAVPLTPSYRHRWPEISPVWFGIVWAASDRGIWGVYGRSFAWRFQWHHHSRIRHRRPDISLLTHGGGPIGPHWRHHMRLYTLTSTFRILTVRYFKSLINMVLSFFLKSLKSEQLKMRMNSLVALPIFYLNRSFAP